MLTPNMLLGTVLSTDFTDFFNVLRATVSARLCTVLLRSITSKYYY
jgi:hypothetical protein